MMKTKSISKCIENHHLNKSNLSITDPKYIIAVFISTFLNIVKEGIYLWKHLLPEDIRGIVKFFGWSNKKSYWRKFSWETFDGDASYNAKEKWLKQEKYPSKILAATNTLDADSWPQCDVDPKDH